MNDALGTYRAAVDAALAEIRAEVTGSDAVSEAVRYALDGGGKRLRPVLCLAAIAAVRHADRPPAAPAAAVATAARAAAAAELIHTYSLVHDDLPCMDDDALRRGRPTVHVALGTPTAMLAGLALIPLAVRILDDAAAQLGVDADRRARAVRELCAGAGAAGMVGGQVLDLEAERESRITLPSLRRVHAMKTGALFAASLRIGALLGGGSDVQVDALGDFGARLGLAFQITDDVLDVTRDAAALGKTPGKDRDADKPTFASLLGIEGAHRAAADEAAAAVQALADAGIDDAVLAGLARFAADRDR